MAEEDPSALRRRKLVTTAIVFGMFAAAIEMTIVSTAMARATGDLGGSDRYAWVISIYGLTSTVSAPLFGKVADLLGRRPGYLAAMSLFLIGSWCSGASWSMNVLIAARAIQGIGAGGMATVALTIVGDLYPAEQRAKVQGLFSAVWGLAGALGPVLGGFIVDYLSWRWVFYLNVPFGLIALTMLGSQLKESLQTRARPSIDWAGALLLTIGIVTLQLGADAKIPGLGRWPMLIAFAFLALFIQVERKAKEPILPLSLFANRTIAVAVAVTSVSGVIMSIVANYVPLFVQGAQAMSTRSTGLALTPFALGWPLGAFAMGMRLKKIGYRRAGVMGFSTIVAGSITLSLVHLGSPLWHVAIGTGLTGIGMGMQSSPLIIAVQSLVAWNQRGAATAAFNFSRNLGGTLGAVIAGSIAAYVIQRSGISHETIDAVLRPNAPPGSLVVRETLANATHLVLTTNTILATLGLIGVFAIPATVSLTSNTETSR